MTVLSKLLCCVLLIAGSLQTAVGQTVQLPTIHQFGYSGSVLVPDGGTAALGSYGSASQSSSQSGWLVPQVNGRSSGITSAGSSVTATIIDLEQMDRELLGQSPQQLRDASRRSPRAVRSVDTNEEGKSLVRYARTLVKQGKLRAARQAYQTALPMLSVELRRLAQQELQQISNRG